MSDPKQAARAKELRTIIQMHRGSHSQLTTKLIALFARWLAEDER